MHFKLLISYSCLVISTQLIAAPNDPFLTAKDFNAKHNAALQMTFAIDAVNDTIDFLDMRQSEGITDKSTGDYQGFHLGANYQINPQWSVEGTYWHREIDYSQDTNKIDSGLIAARYTPALNLNKNDALTFRASLWGNTANTLTKSTPTKVNQRTFQNVKVEDPQDLQLQLDGIFSRKLDPMNQLNAFVSVGYSKVEVSQLQIQAMQQGCLMNVNINSSNQYTGNLAQPCKSGSITLTDLAISGNANEFGLEIDKDLNYDSYFTNLGASWNWRYQQFESQVAYHYQRLWRKNIDDRVNQFGNSAIKDNHTLGMKFSYDFSPTITGFVQGEIYQNNFVGYIPFVYNGVTASRLEKRYGLASIGLQARMF
ncbi:hypothetical protein D7V68_10000 [Acinetobacter cumulans]|uniref:hypothetical protein n=1 Tax=Acinetobacter cumulans TaxID=2136182 RepID=UPI000EA36E5D|nr:hypothetical protein [Acinetobacter cumulans]RKG47857.1 hypothetical protein D7V68_10000 [Acinetobacter cumulans]